MKKTTKTTPRKSPNQPQITKYFKNNKSSSPPKRKLSSNQNLENEEKENLDKPIPSKKIKTKITETKKILAPINPKREKKKQKKEESSEESSEEDDSREGEESNEESSESIEYTKKTPKRNVKDKYVKLSEEDSSEESESSEESPIKKKTPQNTPQTNRRYNTRNRSKTLDLKEESFEESIEKKPKKKKSEKKDIVGCLRDNLVKEFTEFLKQEDDLNSYKYRGQTLLHLAVENDPPNHDIINLLLKKKADPNAKNKNGKSPLNLICVNQKADVSIIKTLISHKADVNSSTKYGWTPILFSTTNNRVEITHCLLESGADVNICAKTIGSCLHIAASKDFIKLVTLFLSFYPIDLTLLDNKDNTAFDVAISRKNKGVLLLLEEYSTNGFINWTPEKHFNYPSFFTLRVLNFLLCHRVYTSNKKHLKIPKFVLHHIFSFTATPYY